MIPLLFLAAAAAAAPTVDRAAIFGQLAPIISSTVARQDTQFPVFHGCLDWHSAVHGHWALLRMDRWARKEGVEGGYAEKAAAADRALSVEGLKAEAETLKKNPAFEMPYGRAWFLRLAIEHESWSRETRGADPLRLRPMADQVAQSLLDYFAEFPPSPMTRTYNNAAWALAQLHAYLRSVEDRKRLAQAQALISGGFLGDEIMTFGTDRSTPEFFSPFGNWAYLIVKTQAPEIAGAFLDKRPIKDEELGPIEKLVPYPHRLDEKPTPFAHQMGMNWSRAWALKALRREEAFAAHVEQGMKHHKLFAGDFRTYDHWVPQFAVYALTEGEIE